MARIFSIEFNFKQQQYTALVTAGTALNGNVRYMVAPNDETLKQLLPEGRICFNNLSELQPIADRQPRLHELMHSIASAVYQKIEPATG